MGNADDRIGKGVWLLLLDKKVFYVDYWSHWILHITLVISHTYVHNKLLCLMVSIPKWFYALRASQLSSAETDGQLPGPLLDKFTSIHKVSTIGPPKSGTYKIWNPFKIRFIGQQ